MAEPIRIYLAEQTIPNIGKWEIYREGKPTGEMITNKVIRNMLTDEQYKQFLLGETIFKIPGPVFKARNWKQTPEKKGMTYFNQRRLKSK